MPGVPVRDNFRKTAHLTFGMQCRRVILFATPISFLGVVMSERVRISQLVLIRVVGIRGVHPCTVVDFWGDGATLHSTTYHTASFEFELSFDGFKTTKHCHVVWRAGNTCGVEFVRPPQIPPRHLAIGEGSFRRDTCSG